VAGAKKPSINRHWTRWHRNLIAPAGASRQNMQSHFTEISMRSILTSGILLACATTQLQAQTTATDPNPMVASVRREWQMIIGFITKAAEQMPESNYSFKPTPAVRSFGQLIGHLADGQDIICAAALAQPSTAAEGDIEKKVTAKADLIVALRTSSELCTRAYAQTDAATLGMTKLFGQDRTRYAALMRNAVHDGEHYGNLVTYIRLKGMIPPSSQPPPTSAR
jgi:uncharacterized damage-inducible protein DinB